MTEEEIALEMAKTQSLIESYFDKFRTHCISNEARDDQIEDMRLSYFAGAQLMYTTFDLLRECKPETQMFVIDSLYKELMAYKRRVEQEALENTPYIVGANTH